MNDIVGENPKKRLCLPLLYVVSVIFQEIFLCFEGMWWGFLADRNLCYYMYASQCS